MGDMADMLLEQMECGDGSDLYFANLMYEEETDSYIPPRLQKILTCRFCGKSPLQWKKIDHRWIMHEPNGYIHECPENPLISTLFNKLKNNKENMSETSIKNYQPPNWDTYFMKMVYLVAEKSRDPRTKIGAVLVKNKNVIATGYNGFPVGVIDLPERYLNRETKYKFVVHAEHNTVLQCARNGISSIGSTLYSQGLPCNSCMKSILQGGVKEIVIHTQWPGIPNSQWNDEQVSKDMIKESGIKVRYFGGILSVKGYLDGKVIEV